MLCIPMSGITSSMVPLPSASENSLNISMDEELPCVSVSVMGSSVWGCCVLPRASRGFASQLLCCWAVLAVYFGRQKLLWLFFPHFQLVLQSNKKVDKGWKMAKGSGMGE